MKWIYSSALMALVAACTGLYAGTTVAFIGLAGEGAPGIEKNFTKLFEERLLTQHELKVIDNEEVLRLQTNLDLFTFPVMTAPLAAAIGRFAPDSSFVVWGMVSNCRVRLARKFYFKTQIRGELTLMLAVYDVATKSYAYCGEITATATIDKGYTFWFGPIDEGDQISAPERALLLDSLQTKAVVASSAALLAVVERAKGTAGSGTSAEVTGKSTVPALSADTGKKSDLSGAGLPASGGGIVDSALAASDSGRK